MTGGARITRLPRKLFYASNISARYFCTSARYLCTHAIHQLAHARSMPNSVCASSFARHHFPRRFSRKSLVVPLHFDLSRLPCWCVDDVPLQEDLECPNHDTGPFEGSHFDMDKSKRGVRTVELTNAPCFVLAQLPKALSFAVSGFAYI